MKKKVLYWCIGLFIFCGWVDLVWGQTTFTQEEALEMIKQRDAEWKGKLSKLESIDSAKTVQITQYEDLIKELEEQANIDSLTLVANDKQIELLKARDVANEKMVKLIEKKWYENEYIWLGIGFILGKLQ